MESTPEEALEASYAELQEGLASEILESIRKCSSVFFERLVIDVLVKIGYGGSRREAGQAIGKTGDEGIDGIIKEEMRHVASARIRNSRIVIIQHKTAPGFHQVR